MSDYLNLGRLADELRRDRARPYRQASRQLQQRIDALPVDAPERPRLIALANAARQRAEAIEGGTP